MAPHQERVVNEKSELDEKISKLNDFLAVGPIYATLPAEEQERLGRQIGIMRDYSEVLGQRIAAFPAA